jgi:hypothetical protein
VTTGTLAAGAPCRAAVDLPDWPAVPLPVVVPPVVVAGIEWARYPVVAATAAISAAAVELDALREARRPLSRAYLRCG